ncbi:hypothetical protein GCM10022254_42030 [Actinomadura meridiana]|uniref:Uncharacterized protein n=1 Tax=Actinomadura meridiana TaxID=559626 RepID=A0ABP8C803_9ACTN
MLVEDLFPDSLDPGALVRAGGEFLLEESIDHLVQGAELGRFTDEGSATERRP